MIPSKRSPSWRPPLGVLGVVVTVVSPGAALAEAPARMTTEEMLALPKGEFDRVPYLGDLREFPMTTKDVPHGFLNVRIGSMRFTQPEDRPAPRGLALGGEARVCTRWDLDTTFGIGVAYCSTDLAARTSEGARVLDGRPTLEVVICLPSDTFGKIAEQSGA